MGVPNLYPGAGRRVKPVSVAVGVVLGGTLLLISVGLAKAGPGVWTALTTTAFQSHGPLTSVAASVGRALSLSTLNPWYWGFVFLLTVIQWFWPARRDQRSPSIDMAVDAVWFVAGNIMQVTVVAITLGAATVAYNQLPGNWSLNLQPVLGFWGLSIFAFVVADLLAWISHWCHHKVSTLWHFHAVHHSQQRLNALSDNRTHVGEVVAAALIIFVPAHMLGLQASAALGLAFIGLFYSAMLHSNIRSDLGPLKYVFMGPQAHRIHHSILPRHFESNFGTVFSWWDYIAGTMYTGYDEYPPTGIRDTSFPLRIQGDFSPWSWLVTFAHQLVYPFRGLANVSFVRRSLQKVSESGTSTREDARAKTRHWGVHGIHGALAHSVPVSGVRESRNYHIPEWLPRRQWTVALHTPDSGLRVFGTPDPLGPRTRGEGMESAWMTRPASELSAEGPPAGWYEDPLGEGLRFWDGDAWDGLADPAMSERGEDLSFTALTR